MFSVKVRLVFVMQSLRTQIPYGLKGEILPDWFRIINPKFLNSVYLPVIFIFIISNPLIFYEDVT